jgi:hypothetical protein
MARTCRPFVLQYAPRFPLNLRAGITHHVKMGEGLSLVRVEVRLRPGRTPFERPNLVGVYVVGLGVCGPTLFVHDPHAPGFTVALGGVDVDRVDDPVNPPAVEDGAPALRTVGNRQVVAHGASLARQTSTHPLRAHTRTSHSKSGIARRLTEQRTANPLHA